MPSDKPTKKLRSWLIAIKITSNSIWYLFFIFVGFHIYLELYFGLKTNRDIINCKSIFNLSDCFWRKKIQQSLAATLPPVKLFSQQRYSELGQNQNLLLGIGYGANYIRTPNEAFLIEIPNLCAYKFLGLWGLVGQFTSTHYGTLLQKLFPSPTCWNQTSWICHSGWT